jgi:hypothetical protein
MDDDLIKILYQVSERSLLDWLRERAVELRGVPALVRGDPSGKTFVGIWNPWKIEKTLRTGKITTIHTDGQIGTWQPVQVPQPAYIDLEECYFVFERDETDLPKRNTERVVLAGRSETEVYVEGPDRRGIGEGSGAWVSSQNGE